MMLRLLPLYSVVVVLSFAYSALAQSTSDFERPALPPVRELLAPELVAGPHFKVTDPAQNDGYFTTYTLVSDFGTFVVEGQPMLELRIAELVALQELDELSSTTVFADAAYQAGKGIVLAPVKLIEKTYDRVSDPEKMLETVQSVPEGAERLFSWAYRQVKSVTSAAGDMVSSGPTATPNPTGPEVSTSSALQQGKKLGLNFIGYSKREREWFRKLKVSPYTSNDRLQSEIERVAAIETAVGIGFKFVPGLGLLGQLGTVSKWYDRAEKLSLYEEPGKIAEKNASELKELGISPEVSGPFVKNKAYTPWSRRFVIASLRAIGPSVKGHEHFIRAATVATNEPSALYFVAVAEALEKIHKKDQLKHIVASMQLPAGITKKGVLVVPLAVDYLFWTSEVAEIFRDFKSRVMKEAKFSSVEVRIRGRASKRSIAALTAMGTKVKIGVL
jgi:hypothetical protein